MSFRFPLRGIGVVFGLGAALTLVGCGDMSAPVGSSMAGSEITGVAHGGQQPITGANVYMYAAGTTSGYGAGSTSLLGGAGYVVTSSTGTFSLGTSYSCPSPSSQIYLTVVGGNTGSGVNSKSVLMTALGSCGNLNNSTFVNINEVSTVATVYALAQFMKVGTTPGSVTLGTSSLNITGLSNAFNAVSNLIDPAQGFPRTTTPAGNGTVPATEINTLADIMAACVNTTGGPAGACANLFKYATPPGGTAPGDTLGAILNIALNPGNNVLNLFNVPTAQGAFQPSLAGSPNDWTISVEYSGGGLNAPQLPAVDGSGNIWVPNATDPGTLSEFSPVGAPITSSAGFTGGGLSYPESVAVDVSGNVWTSNEGNSTVSKHTNGGSPLSGSGYTATGLKFPYAIALDSAGNVFTANGNNSVTKLNSSGGAVANFTGGGLDVPYAVAIDASQNVWIVNSGFSNSVTKFNNSGTPASTVAYTGGGMFGPVELAIDATGDTWVANFNNASTSKMTSTGTPLSGAGYVTPADVSAVAVDGSNTTWTANTDGSISHLSTTGAAISPSTGYTTAGATGEVGIVVDASGNIWTTDNYVNSIFEYVGAASPAVVPLQLAVKNNTIGTRP